MKPPPFIVSRILPADDGKEMNKMEMSVLESVYMAGIMMVIVFLGLFALYGCIQLSTWILGKISKQQK